MPLAFYQIQALIAEHLGSLRPAQQRGLAVWVYGTLLAGSSCLNAVLVALCTHCTAGVRPQMGCGFDAWDRWRQYLREWLRDGKSKAKRCQAQVEVASCFAPLLIWVLRWLDLAPGSPLFLAVDATSVDTRVTTLVVSLLYRGSAIPLAWHVMPGNTPGAWIEPIEMMLSQLQAAIASTPSTPSEHVNSTDSTGCHGAPRLQVTVLCDRGLWSPRLYRHIRRIGWHPLMRVQNDLLFRPTGAAMIKAASLVSSCGQPDSAWVGSGVAFRDAPRQLHCTLVAVWLAGEKEPCLALTDLRPRALGPQGAVWYGLRMWIELGFRSLKNCSRASDGIGSARSEQTRSGSHVTGWFSPSRRCVRSPAEHGSKKPSRRAARPSACSGREEGTSPVRH
jgi:hypothetical protein